MRNTGYPSIDRVHEIGYKKSEINPIIPPIGVYNLLQLTSNKYRDAVAIDCLEVQLTYKEILNKATIVAKAFKVMGVKRRDIISVQTENLWQSVVCFFAANRIGATLTYLNSKAEIDEVKHYLNLFESPILINYARDEKYNESIKKDTKVKYIVTIAEDELNDKDFFTEKKWNKECYISFRELGAIANLYKKTLSPIQSGKNDALILFTSGTTGNPKSVVLTNENIVATAIYAKNTTKLGNRVGESTLSVVPFSYPYGFITSGLLAYLCGRTTILCPWMSDENINYYYSKKPNIIFGSPAFYEMTMRYVKQNLASVKFGISGGDFLYESKAEEIINYFKAYGSNINLTNGSGNAESCGGNTNAFGKNYAPTCVGSPYVGTCAIVINPDTLEELKYGEEGMYCVSGKNVFKEYYKEPELTRQAKFMYKGKEYLKTGTNGILNSDGVFNLTGRSSRFYIMSSLNKVYLDHVQIIVSAIDIIKECAIVKKPDNDKLYVNKAYIILKDGIEPTDETKDEILMKLKEQVTLHNGERAQLKPYEIPSSIEFIKELPRTIGTEKIDYKPLEEMALEEYKNE